MADQHMSAGIDHPCTERDTTTANPMPNNDPQQGTTDDQDTMQLRGFPSQDLQDNDMQQQATTGQNTPQDAQATQSDQAEAARGGMPGDGAGRRDETGISGVYPVSASQGASGDAPSSAKKPGARTAPSAAPRAQSITATVAPMRWKILKRGSLSVVVGPCGHVT
jgi:hypothetical protein